MTLAPGTLVGHYEIRDLIGAGGMGEVYRARDSKLDRDVALKILPATFADDPDRLARFEREAKALAALNHPQIAHVYGLDKQEGQEGTARPAAAFIAMELVDGEDLSARIARGALPAAEALPIARQIAEALEAAHEVGIIHRDLKPANVKVRPDGVVKVLDFGLAKALEAGASGAVKKGGPGGLTHSPTMLNVSMPGMILGTAAYMSPEQAKGREADKRADIWAFGVVLFEMLTGRALFQAETVTETLAAVLTREVRVAELPAATPRRVRELVRRCLERDPTLRLRDIGEARILLARGAEDEPAAPEHGTVPSVRAWRHLFVAVSAAVILAALATSLVWSTLRPASSVPVRILDLADTVGVQFVALSPDGTTVAYAKPDGLFLRRLDATSATRVVERDDVKSLTFSPDGESIAYYASQDVRVVRKDGSEDRTVFRDIWRNDVQLAWVGDALYVPATDGIRRVPIAGGDSTLVVPTPRENATPLRHPVVLEDGRTILVNPGLGGSGRFDFGTIWAFRDGKGAQVLSLPQARIGGFSFDAASGYLLIDVSDRERRAVWKAPFDVATLTAGPPQPLLAGGGPSLPSADGTVALITGGARDVVRFARSLEWRGLDGNIVRKVSQRQDDLRDFSLSPDGRRLAVRASSEIGSAGGLWVYDLETGLQTLISPDITNRAQASWSPDGRRLAFRAGDGTLRVVTLGTNQPPEVLTKAARNFPTWTRDGTRIVFSRGAPGGKSEIVEIDQDGSAPAKVLGAMDGPIGAVSLSPDGRWLAYESGTAAGAAPGADRSVVGRSVSITDFPGLSTRVQVSGDGATAPQWSQDGSAVWFVQGGREFVSVSLRIVAGRPSAAAPRLLWSAPKGAALFSSIGGRRFGTIDGKQFLLEEPVELDTGRVTIIQNLPALLKGRQVKR